MSADVSRSAKRCPIAINLGLRILVCISAAGVAVTWGQVSNPQSAPRDAVIEAQQPSSQPVERPEQEKTDHDRSGAFDPPNAMPSSPIFQAQPQQGKNSGFDFYRDPLNSDRPAANPDEIMRQLSADKQRVMAAQQGLLENRYNLQPHLDPTAKMSRGKPLVVGPTARLPQGISWDRLAGLTAVRN